MTPLDSQPPAINEISHCAQSSRQAGGILTLEYDLATRLRAFSFVTSTPLTSGYMRPDLAARNASSH